MFASPKFSAAGLRRILQTVLTSLPIVHETASQNIQGGIPGERFHITEAEHEFVQNATTTGLKIYEPVMYNGDLVLDSNGDVAVAWGGKYAS